MLLTIAALTIPNRWQAGGSSLTLKIYAGENFYALDGATAVFVQSDRIGGTHSFYTITCPIVGDDITIPSVEILTTTDSPTNGRARYSGAIFYDSDGVKIGSLIDDFAVSHRLSNPTTWDSIERYNRAPRRRIETNYYTSDQTDAQIAAAVEAVAYGKASVAQVGLTAISRDSVNPLFPIAVGDNDERLEDNVARYASLAAAITAIGSTPTVLEISANANVATACVVPTTLFLRFRNGAKLIKTGSGSITFQGIGTFDAASQIPLFSGFAAGQIVWSGVKPAVISTEIIDTGDDSLSTRIEILDAAFSSKAPILKCYPRTITKFIQVENFRQMIFTPGEYANTRNDNATRAAFEIDSNTSAFGYGATLFESASNGMGAMFAPLASNTLASFENIYVEGFRFKGVGAIGGIASTVIFGNCANAALRNCVFDTTTHYNLLGGTATDGNYGQNQEVSGCTFINVNTQAVAVVNCINFRITNNNFYSPVIGATTFSSVDIEPNVDTDRAENGLIDGNRFYMPNDNSFVGVNYCIAAQAALDGSIKNLTICNNAVIGADVIPVPANLSPMAAGISVFGVTNLNIYDNYIQSAYAQGAITIQLSRFCQIYNNQGFQCSHANSEYGGMGLFGVADSDIYNNVFNKSNLPGASGNQPANIIESEVNVTVTTSGTTISNTYFQSGQPSNSKRFYDLMVGLQVVINTVTYTIDTFTSQAIMNTSVSMPTMTRKTFTSANVNAGTGNIAITGHGYLTGGLLFLSGTDVPANVNPDTFYYAIRIDDDNLKLATTLANALATTPITFGDTGSGTSTITPGLRTKFSSNRFWGNKAADGISRETTGTSVIYSTASDVTYGLTATPAELNQLSGLKFYTAIISQSGMSAPTAVVKNNTLGGTVVLAYGGVGVYTLTLSGAFPTAARTFFTLAWNNSGGGSGVMSVNPVWTSANVVTLNVFDRDNGAIDLDTNSPISLKIEVYPT